MRPAPALLVLLPLAACSGGQDAPGPPPAAGAAGAVSPAGALALLPPIPPGRDIAAAPGWQLRPLASAPPHFLARGWADARTVWGLSGTDVLLLPIDGSEPSSWTGDAWDASLSPAGATLAWINGRGVWVGDRSGAPRLLLRRDATAAGRGDLTGPLLWAPGGDRLLVRWGGEGAPAFGVVEVTSGRVREIPSRGDGFLLVEAFGWLDPDRVLFSAQPRLATDGRAVEWTGLAVYDGARGGAERVAGGEGEEGLVPLARWGEDGILAATGAPGAVERVILFDTRAWSRHPTTLPPGRRIVVHDTTAAVVVEELGEREGEREHGLLLWSAGTGEVEPLARVRGDEVRIAWSPGGERLVLSRSVRVPVPGEPGSFREVARTGLLEPAPR